MSVSILKLSIPAVMNMYLSQTFLAKVNKYFIKLIKLKVKFSKSCLTNSYLLDWREELFQMIAKSMNFMLYWMVGSSTIDERIIYSWCFIFVECLDLTSSAAIDILIQNMESLSSLNS